MSARPFFSLIIPCYNDGRYKAGLYLDRLLTSVTQSNLDYDDIEIILADDHSPVSYTRTINKFKKYFNIKLIETEYQFAPGNTRQAGTAIAIGQWMCFADHDDTFYPRALHTVKDFIENSDSDLVYVHADFDKVANDNIDNIVETFYQMKNNALKFVHGKFYNRDKLWKPGKLHFPKDLRTHEDIALGNQVECVLDRYQSDQIMYIPTPVYRWTDNVQSISNTQYSNDGDNPFLERCYKDYLTSGIGQYIDRCESGDITPMQLAQKALPSIFGCWFELANFKINSKEHYIEENFYHVKDIWTRFKEVSHLSTVVIKMMVAQGAPELIKSINATAVYYGLDDVDTWIAKLDSKGDETDGKN